MTKVKTDPYSFIATSLSHPCEPAGQKPSASPVEQPTAIWKSFPDQARWLIATALVAACIGCTFISYQSYLFFKWDDVDYFARSIAASRAFWSGDLHRLGEAMVSIRPPAMTLMGLPWGQLTSWDNAGNCFITLAAAISLSAVVCFYLLSRIGINPLFLMLAAACVALSIGPFPPGSAVHADATSFIADNFFAWTALAAVLLIPLEARTQNGTIGHSVMHGILWGAILSCGTMTKFNFLYFVASIAPILLFLRFHRHGLRSAVSVFIAFVCCSAPAAIYLLRYGRAAFENAKASSFGAVSELYYRPLISFLAGTFAESPGMALSFFLIAAAIAYLVMTKKLVRSWPDLIAFLIMTGFLAIVLAATNRQIRYAFPAIVGLPFLAGRLLSGDAIRVPRRFAVVSAGFILCALVAASVPMRHRPDPRSLNRPNAILAAASQWNATNITLATDSPTLNGQLMTLAGLFSSRSFSTSTLAYQAMYGIPIEQDFQLIRNADVVVFQDARHIKPKFTNQRAWEYEQYVLQGGCTPIRVAGDISLYRTRCNP